MLSLIVGGEIQLCEIDYHAGGVSLLQCPSSAIAGGHLVWAMGQPSAMARPGHHRGILYRDSQCIVSPCPPALAAGGWYMVRSTDQVTAGPVNLATATAAFIGLIQK